MASTQKKKLSKVFLDSSVVMAASISSTGAGRKIINQGFRKEIKLFISNDVLEETERNLKLKAPEGLPYFVKFHTSLIATIVKPTKKQVKEAAKIVVGKDAPIVAGAIKANADFLVSYDQKHILNKSREIDKQFGIRVTTPDKVK